MMSQMSKIEKKKETKVKEISVEGDNPPQPSTPTVSGQKAPEDKKAGESSFKADGAANLFGKKAETSKTSFSDLTGKGFGLSLDKPSAFNLFSKNNEEKKE